MIILNETGRMVARAVVFRKEPILFIVSFTHKTKNTDDIKAFDALSGNIYPFLRRNYLFITYFNPSCYNSMPAEYYFIRQQFFASKQQYFMLFSQQLCVAGNTKK